LRGEGVLNEDGPGHGQWNAWATLLIERPEFFGTGFSSGDLYIAERATNWNRTGSAQSWLQAGFSHHITTTSLQVAGRLKDVRQLTAIPTTTAASWAALVQIDQPEVAL
jgi:hypothetical protein